MVWCRGQGRDIWPKLSPAWRLIIPILPGFPDAGVSGHNPKLAIEEPSGTRFVPMKYAYDPDLQQRLQEAANNEAVTLEQGVYAWYSGPSFETPAEIRAIRTLGADAVGISIVPEVILARLLGLKVAAISTITNMAAGLSDEAIGHEHTKAMAPLGAAKLEKILRRLLSGG